MIQNLGNMNIDVLIKEATLQKNGSAKEAYRAIKSALLLNSTSKNPIKEGKEVYVYNDKIVINELDLSIIRKLIKQREDSISIYEANSREDLASIEREQLKYLKELLPEEISKDRIEELVISLYPSGFPKKEMGSVIKQVKTVFPTADGKVITNVIKSYIK